MPTLNFKGKAFIANHHMAVPYHTLAPKKSKSLTKEPKLEDNLIVHGDNLKALKALLPTYAGRVKCIYIDPPYNTGNEKWAYNDNVNSPMIQEWLGKVVDTEDLTRHDKWLCMMTPRLKLLKELLRDDGVIFISIDDNEVHHLRMLMDEIFGEENFVGNMVWDGGRKNDSNKISIGHEYILVYCKNITNESFASDTTLWKERKEGIDEIYKIYEKSKKLRGFNWVTVSQDLFEWYKTLPNDSPAKAHEHYKYADEEGVYFASDLSGPDDGRKNRPRYEVLHPITRKAVPIPSRGWRWEEPRMKEEIAKNRVHFGVDETSIPNGKVYLKENEWQAPSSVFYRDRRSASGLLRKLLYAKVFDFPKDPFVIQRLVKLVCRAQDIILDSFAGSGTTAHAVLALNKEDGGNRRFILVECEDYADSITAERVRRVIKGVPNAKNEALREGLGGTFSFFELGGSIEIEKLLAGKDLPSYTELARYVFYTATGQEFDEKKINEKKHFIGETKSHEVYLFYKPDVEYLKATALTLDHAKAFGNYKGKRRLVFAPTKYLDQNYLDEFRIDFAQLPFEIYRRVK